MPGWVQIVLQILAYGLGGFVAHNAASNSLISKMPPQAPPAQPPASVK